MGGICFDERGGFQKKFIKSGLPQKEIKLMKRYTNEKYWKASVLFLFIITWKFPHIQYLFTFNSLLHS